MSILVLVFSFVGVFCFPSLAVAVFFFQLRRMVFSTVFLYALCKA